MRNRQHACVHWPSQTFAAAVVVGARRWRALARHACSPAPESERFLSSQCLLAQAQPSHVALARGYRQAASVGSETQVPARRAGSALTYAPSRNCRKGRGGTIGRSPSAGRKLGDETNLNSTDLVWKFETLTTTSPLPHVSPRCGRVRHSNKRREEDAKVVASRDATDALWSRSSVLRKCCLLVSAWSAPQVTRARTAVPKGGVSHEGSQARR